MPLFRALPPVLVVAALAVPAAGQIVPVTQERSVQTAATVSSGDSTGDYDEAADYGPFVRTLTSSVTGAAGAGATAVASQNSSLGSALITGTLGAHAEVSTGATFVTGESDVHSNLLIIFNLAAPTPVQFNAAGSLQYLGRNPNGEPSDLSGIASVRLLDGITEDLIAGFQFFDTPVSDSVTFNGTLPAGQYVILATAQMHAFSADLLGPPPRSGSGGAGASFTLTVVPAPGASAVIGVGMLWLARRRRSGR